MAKSLPTPFNPPPPTTLLGWRHSFADAKRRKFLTPNLMFSGHGSGRVKFETKIYKFNFKFERKNQGAVSRDGFECCAEIFVPRLDK